jgi:protein TonB
LNLDMTHIPTSPTARGSYAARFEQGKKAKRLPASSNNGQKQRGFFRRNGPFFGVGIVILGGVSFFLSQVLKQDHSPARRVQVVYIVRPLPPSPPPPAKVPEPPKEEKMIEQTPMDQPEEKPDDRPKDSPPPLTTGLTGPGADGFGLGAGNGGGGYGGGGGGRRGSRFGWFAGEVQKTVQEALSRNPVINQAGFIEKARIWADLSGRVTRVQLAGSTGNAAVDRAIEATLTGLQLPDLPPKDMPMPIVMRLVARRPG